MNGQQGAVRIPVLLVDVRGVLLRPLEFPDWNPAFRTLTGPPNATIGVKYALTVRPGLTGHFWYSDIGPTHIETRWEVTGMAEIGTWELQSEGSQTIATHRFQHTGPLAQALSAAFRDVADLRLRRLADHATQAAAARLADAINADHRRAGYRSDGSAEACWD